MNNENRGQFICWSNSGERSKFIQMTKNKKDNFYKVVGNGNLAIFYIANGTAYNSDKEKITINELPNNFYGRYFKIDSI